MALKEGPNFEDQNRIREWALEGKTPEEIAQLCLIKLKGVQVYLESIEDELYEEEDED